MGDLTEKDLEEVRRQERVIDEIQKEAGIPDECFWHRFDIDGWKYEFAYNTKDENDEYISVLRCYNLKTKKFKEKITKLKAWTLQRDPITGKWYTITGNEYHHLEYVIEGQIAKKKRR